jgi:serine protease Do
MLASLARALFVLALLVAGGAAPAGAEQVPQSSREITLSFAPVVKRAAPAVINIYTEKEVAASAADPLLADPFFRFFFKDFGRQQMPKRQQNSLGSGVIIAADGLVVTNHHVIDDADAVMVVLNDRREFPAEVVGADAAADLALLRIEAPPGLPVLPMGDSDELEVGDLVLAIGNPFGIGQSVTSGIVSALARSSPKVNDDLSFTQTDAAVNPGNSGGALVTVDGRLVGVNTAIFTRGGGGSIGIGFAIPINLVQALIRSVESGAERLARPWLGARIQTVTVKLAAGLGLDRPTGVVLNQLYADGPAARAGLEQGDVITKIDGTEVMDTQGLNFRLADGRLGEQAGIEIWRQGKSFDVALPLETPPKSPPPDIRQLKGYHALGGATVANLSPGFNEEIGVDLFERGVVVLGVDRRSPAAQLGLRRGDRILTLADRAIDRVATLLDVLDRVRPPWRLAIERRGRELAVTIER